MQYKRKLIRDSVDTAPTKSVLVFSTKPQEEEEYQFSTQLKVIWLLDVLCKISGPKLHLIKVISLTAELTFFRNILFPFKELLAEGHVSDRNDRKETFLFHCVPVIP